MWADRLAETVPRVRDRVRAALERAGRHDDVRIVAVTKGHPPAAARAVLDAGLTALGENRIQELAGKVDALGREVAEWHMIGHLQRNKARQAVALADRIHSVDSLRLARALDAEAGKVGVVAHGLVQVNVSGEASKGGFEEAGLLGGAEELAGLAHLRLHGLMTMAPWTGDESVLRATFRTARALLERCRGEAPGAIRGEELSMGMSNDFEIAIEEGATIVRLGTVLLGERDYP